MALHFLVGVDDVGGDVLGDGGDSSSGRGFCCSYDSLKDVEVEGFDVEAEGFDVEVKGFDVEVEGFDVVGWVLFSLEFFTKVCVGPRWQVLRFSKAFCIF